MLKVCCNIRKAACINWSSENSWAEKFQEVNAAAKSESSS